MFYYNKRNTNHNGIHEENENLKDWSKISFMIFRTGSVLIVGNCDKNILNIVYEFIKDVLKKEYEEIFININSTKKATKEKTKKK